ncbi:MAG: hypothetical protein KGO81_04405 [Bacteroidota bacterium]|nr:hypothetical protein [Bacteroidota bacterium]
MLRDISKLRTFYFTIAVTSLLACKKEEHEKAESKILCRIIPTDSIPQVVRDSFNAKYTKVIPIQWFIKDSIGYCAHLNFNGQQQLALFSNTGALLNVETKMEQTGQYEDSMRQKGKFFKEGCSCEISAEHD